MVTRATPTPELDALVASKPDLVDRIFAYLLKDFPQLGGADLDASKAAVREEFAAEEHYIARRSPSERQDRAQRVLQLFNGRNATEVAREVGISRASVYRLLKQAGGQKKVSSFRGNETAPAVRLSKRPVT